MSSKILGHSFHVPDRCFNIGHHRHETMRHFVDQQVSAVVVVLLFSHPEFVPSVPTMIKWRQIAGNQARFTEDDFIFNEITRHLILGLRAIRWKGSEVLGQRDVRLINDRWQGRGHLGVDVGIQDQPFGFVTANS